MLGQRRPREMPLALGNVMNDAVAGVQRDGHSEIMQHREGFDFAPANRSLSAVEVGLMNAMSRETVLRQYGVLVPALVCPKPDGGDEMVANYLLCIRYTCLLKSQPP